MFLICLRKASKYITQYFARVSNMCTCGKNDFAEVYKNQARYRSENNYVVP